LLYQINLEERKIKFRRHKLLVNNTTYSATRRNFIFKLEIVRIMEMRDKMLIFFIKDDSDCCTYTFFRENAQCYRFDAQCARVYTRA